MPSAERITGSNKSVRERATDPYLVSLVTAAREGRGKRHSENLSVVADELAGTAVRRRTQLINPPKS